MESGQSVGSATEGNYFYYTSHWSGTFITSVEAWEAFSCIRAIKVHFGLGLPSRLYGNPDASSFRGTRHRSHSFAVGERITRLTLWPTRSGNRVGRIEFVTSRGTTFNACMFRLINQPNAPTVVTGLGSGVWVGVQGRAATDLHRLGFLFLRSFTSAILRQPRYTSLQSAFRDTAGGNDDQNLQAVEEEDMDVMNGDGALEEVEEVGGDGEEEEEGLEADGGQTTPDVEYSYSEEEAKEEQNGDEQSETASLARSATISRVLRNPAMTVSGLSETHIVHWIFHNMSDAVSNSAVWSVATNDTLVPAYQSLTQVTGSVPRVASTDGNTFFWQLSSATTTTSIPVPTMRRLWWHGSGSVAPGSSVSVRAVAGSGTIVSIPYTATINLPDLGFSYTTTAGTYSATTFGGVNVTVQ